MTTPITFCVKLADVPLQIRCRYAENQQLMRDWWTEEPPLFTVEAAQADLEYSQTALQKAAQIEHWPNTSFSDVRLEQTALHTLIAEKLVPYGVLLVHGSALCMQGRAYIFTAPSGTGKSTHARFWRQVFGDQVTMINDDKPMLRIQNDRVTVYGTPWMGKHNLGANIAAPLQAIVKLTRDTTNHVEPMTKADAFVTLMEQGFHGVVGETEMQTMALKQALVNAVHFYRLGCNPTPQAAQVAWQALQADIAC